MLAAIQPSGNGNQNHNTTSHTVRCPELKKTSAGEEVEKLESAYIAGGNVNWEGVTVGQRFKKVDKELPCDTAITFLGRYKKKLKAGTRIDICTLTFTAASFTIAQRWKQFKCPSMIQRINSYAVEYYSAIKGNLGLTHASYNLDEP